MNNTQPVSSVTVPASPVITLEEFKLFAGIDAAFTADDTLLASAIAAGTDYCEWFTGRQLGIATRVLHLPGLSGRIYIPAPPLSSVVSIDYTDANGDPAVVDPANYNVYNADPTLVGYVQLTWSGQWPTCGDAAYPASITYTAGYSTVPDMAINAINMFAKQFYDDAGIDHDTIQAWLKTSPGRVYRW